MVPGVSSDAIDRLNAKHSWWPQPGPQTIAYFADHIDELFFGGAKYGGKSSFLIGDYQSDVDKYGKNWQGILFRQTFPELQEIMRQCYEVYPRVGAEYHKGDREWRFPNGAALKMRYLERVEDFFRYNGFSFTWIGVDELPQWPSLEGYHMLKGCLRWAEADVPVKRIRATGNPGGPGHQAVRAYFQIDRYPLGMHPIYDKLSKMWRVFVPSHVSDNQLGLARDPGYIDRLNAVGSPALVKAWLEGDWSIVTGAYFPEFGLRHIIEPFEVPGQWLRFRAFDWGSARPFCCGWYAVADGEHHPEITRGAVVQYREWYGCEPGQSNVGLKLPADYVAAEIVKLTGKEEIAYSVADPAVFTEDGGPSIGETMRKAGAVFRPADNKRIPGWEQVRMRFRGEDDHPMFYVFSTCSDLIRTVPSLQHDRHRAEDIDTDGEDHAADTLRYALMSRPYAPPISAKLAPPPGSGAALIAETLRRKQNRGRRV